MIAACAGVPVRRDSPTPGAVQGILTVLPEPGDATDLGPVVVLLERTDQTIRPAAGSRIVLVESHTESFEPALAVAGINDTIIFVNQGRLKHRLFSADRNGNVAVPLDPVSESAPVGFVAAGVTQFYCSLHPDELVSVLVVGTPHYAIARNDGSYVIPRVPDGEYRLSVWSDVVAGPVRTIQIDSGRTVIHRIWIDPKLLVR